MFFFPFHVCLFSRRRRVRRAKYMNIRREERDDENTTPSRTKDEREKRISALVRVRGRLATGGGSGPSSLSLSFFLSFFKVLLLLLSFLEKVSSLSFRRERERERDRCVCKTGWMRFSRLSRPTKRRERSSRGSFFHSPFFGLDEKKRNNNKKKVNSTKCDLTILSLSLFLSLFNNNNNNNNNNNTIKTQQQSRRRG